MKTKHFLCTLPALVLLASVSISAHRSSHPSLTAVADTVTNGASNTIDEVLWVVGDEAILKSDVEVMRLQAEAEGVQWKGNPDCAIPEQLAVQKLFLHQAAIDSIQVTESEINQSIEDQLNYWIQMIGSKEKLEEYRKQTVAQMRQEMHDEFKNRELVQKMRQKLVSDISVSPAEVRNYFKDMPQDSLPMIPTTVEVQIITNQPKVSPEEVNRVKDQLREFTDRVNKVFAEGLFARIALAAAGKAQRPADDAIGTGDVGTNRVSSDPDLTVDKLYRRALTHLENAIGKASLEDYEQYWRNFNNFDNMTAGPAFETLYVIPFSDSRGRWNYAFAVRSDGSSYTNGASRGGDTGPVPTFWFQYDEQDVRRDITCVNWKINADDTFEPAGIAKWYFGKYRYDWMVKHPYDGNQTEDGAKPVVMRYADILLMAAEIANELGDFNAAKGYFLPVRERAFKGHEEAAEAYVNGISSKEAMFNAIVDERAFEFCGEMLRKGDLIRWGLLKSKMDEAKAEMFKLRDLKAPYDYMSGDIYFQITDDPSEFTIYGLHRGETLKPSGDWEKKGEYITKTVDNKGVESGLYDDRINGIYMADPEQHMFWP